MEYMCENHEVLVMTNAMVLLALTTFYLSLKLKSLPSGTSSQFRLPQLITRILKTHLCPTYSMMLML